MSDHNQDKGITKIIAGIISAIGNILSFTILKPVASIKNPPQALKSEIIDGDVNGKMKRASKKRITKMMNCGIAIMETA